MVGENRVSCLTLTVRLGLGAYVHRVTTGRTSSLNTIRPLYGFSGRTSFSHHGPPILQLLGLQETS